MGNISTIPSDILPNMLLVGAAKCGTTSLAEFLRLHPDIYMSGTKELSFFLPPAGQRIDSLESYRACFAPAGDQSIRGEASVNYLYYADSPRLIRETLGPDVKLIVMLRRHLDMAYSLWGHNRRLEREPRDFQDALDHESARAAGADELIGWRSNYLYRDRATYAPQIRRYREHFDPGNIRIMLFEDVIRDPEGELSGLCDWLGVSRDIPLEFPRLNPAGTNRVRILRRWMDGGSRTKRLLKRIVPDPLRLPVRALVESINRTERTMEKLDPVTRSRLEGLFTNDVSELSELLGHDLHESWTLSGTRKGSA